MRTPSMETEAAERLRRGGCRIVESLTVLLCGMFLTGCESERWYKGNTHAHTVLCGHADSSPEAVTQWYHDRGYHFLCLSEHNRFIDPTTVKMPDNARKDFILIPSEEITGGDQAHTTALNIEALVDPRLIQPAGASKTQVMQAHVHGAEERKGRAILNHPNFHYRNSVEDIRPVKGLHLFELHNGHPQVNNFGDETHLSVEAMWDELLTDGMLIYGVSSDDAHQFQTMGPEHSNPGRGWVMVRAAALDAEAIEEAMYRGDFYATNGVILKVAENGADRISVVVDERATMESVASPFVMGRSIETGQPGYRIQLVGPGGETLRSVSGTRAVFSVSREFAYLRVRIEYTRNTDSGFERFYAWMQPVFTDGRRHFVK